MRLQHRDDIRLHRVAPRYEEADWGGEDEGDPWIFELFL